MPAASIDTFFACTLMVLIVLSAMAATSKFLYPQIYAGIGNNLEERYKTLSEYLLLNEGAPANWGQNSATSPETFGLGDSSSNIAYELDIDKVSRLNSENLYAVTYAQMFTSLKISDASFRIEIKPVFQVSIDLVATFVRTSDTIYEFEILTEKHGSAVNAALKCYVVAEHYLWASNTSYNSGNALNLDVSIPNSVNGSALLIVFAKSVSNTKIVSFNAYSFEHNSPMPGSRGTFLRLSPLNYSLTANYLHSETTYSNAYALTFNYYSTMTPVASNNQSATFTVPHFLDLAPTLLVLTGYNATTFFTEWTAYPQVPVQTGADLTNPAILSDVFTFTYLVTINSAIYECSVWMGGPKD